MKNNLFLSQMGKRIKEARNRKGITLRELEKLTDIDMANVSRIENGKINVHILTLKSIADVLEVDVKTFL